MCVCVFFAYLALFGDFSWVELLALKTLYCTSPGNQPTRRYVGKQKNVEVLTLKTLYYTSPETNRRDDTIPLPKPTDETSMLENKKRVEVLTSKTLFTLHLSPETNRRDGYVGKYKNKIIDFFFFFCLPTVFVDFSWVGFLA